MKMRGDQHLLVLVTEVVGTRIKIDIGTGRKEVIGIENTNHLHINTAPVIALTEKTDLEVEKRIVTGIGSTVTVDGMRVEEDLLNLTIEMMVRILIHASLQSQ